MFGLTKREQRWNAEQLCGVETVLAFVETITSAVAEVRIAELESKAKADALEIEKLRAKVALIESSPQPEDKP